MSSQKQSAAAAAAATAPERRRATVLARHLTAAAQDVSSLPLPPVVKPPEGQFFPTFAQMKEVEKREGGVFTIEAIGGRR